MTRIIDLLERAAKLNLWLSSKEIRKILKLKEKTYRIYMERIRRKGPIIERRGERHHFEYMLRKP